MLLAGRVDTIAGDFWVFSGIVKKLKINRPLRTVMILGEEHLFNAFSKKVENYEKLKEDFDRGLELIKADGTYNNILEKHGLLGREGIQ